MSLNDKITKYFPDFRLYDTISTGLVTVRDMLTHRIGTKTFQGDFTFWNTTFNARPDHAKDAVVEAVLDVSPGLWLL